MITKKAIIRSLCCVAGPGIAPGLGDYASCNLQFLGVSDYIIPDVIGIWRIVSTDFHLLVNLSSVLPLSISMGFYRYSQILSRWFPIGGPIFEPPVQLYTTPRYLCVHW